MLKIYKLDEVLNIVNAERQDAFNEGIKAEEEKHQIAITKLKLVGQNLQVLSTLTEAICRGIISNCEVLNTVSD